MKEAYIYDAVRTPRGKGKKNGELHEVKPIDLVRVVLDAIQSRSSLPTAKIDDVILGCVTSIGEQGANLARTGVLYAGWNSSVTGMQINRYCASGLEAVNLAAMKVRSGWEQLVVAGGVESMSRVPMGSDLGPLSYDPMVSTQIGYVPQGIGADLIASKLGMTRTELDEYALLSHQRAYHAMQNGYFDKSIIPVRDSSGMLILAEDEQVRPNSDLETLAKLPASFERVGKNGYDAIVQMRYPAIEKVHHLHTAGNSARDGDGASLLLIGSKSIGEQLGLIPRAKIKIAASASVNATIALEGIIPATQKALKKANMTADDIDLWEVNESFSAPVLQFQRDFDLPIDKLNVNGGAIAFSHPVGASGAMLLSTLLDELERRDLNTGLVSLCMGGGMGVTTIIERC